jgi:hypothetical protein
MKFLLAVVVVFSLGLVNPLSAQEPPEISSLTPMDQQYMEQQRERLQGLAIRHLGRNFSGERKRDLPLLQSLLDNKLVGANQTRELQAMGVVLGDHLAADLNMHWVIYADKIGRSRALRYRETDTFVFPMTMISRRQEVGNTTSVETIYQKAYDRVDAVRVPLPFSGTGD